MKNFSRALALICWPCLLPFLSWAAAPSNDDCANAITLTPGNGTCTTILGTTAEATQSLPAITCAAATGTADDDVWYKFVATATNHTVNVVGGIDAVVDVRSGACNGTNIACADAANVGGTETLPLAGLTVGNTYLIRIYSFGSSAANQGVFTICVTTPIAPPANDDCANAIALTPGTTCSPTNGTTAGATQSLPAISCGSFGGATADDDVWYKFVATATNHTVTVEGATGFDAVVDVRSGACNGTNIACADAFPNGGTEIVQLTSLTVGSTYLIRVYSFSNSAPSPGDFTICVTIPAIANNDCANAITLTPSTTCSPTNGSTVSATQSLAAITCAALTGTADDDVWYTFVAVSTNHTVTVAGSPGFNAVVDVRSGACNGTNIGCADATASGGTETVALAGLTVGNTYLIRVYGFGSTAADQGSFTICVTYPGPANDDCANAITLTPGATCSPTNGTTVNATQSLAAITCGALTGTADDDVWYKFVATTSNHTVTVVGLSGFNAVVDVRSGVCNGANLACADATLANGTETAQLTSLTVGNTYLIRIYSFGNGGANQGTFTICVTNTPPANDDCANAITLTPGSGTCSPITGTTISATQSLAALSCGGDTGTADDDVWYKFVATNTNHTVTVVGGIDAVVDVRSGACNGANIACADAANANGIETLPLTSLTVGSTYLIRIYSFGNSAANQGIFTICVSTPVAAPANDDCANAITLIPSPVCSPINGTTAGATQSLPAISCGSFGGATADDDVWYQFVATATDHTVTVAGATGFDAVIDVRSGACDGTNIACADAFPNGGTEIVPLTSLTVGSTYLIRVYSYSNSAASPGDFTICVTGPAPVAANDDCANAITLTSGVTCSPTSVSTVGATQSLAAITCGALTGTADDDVWYKFVATATNHTVTVAGSTGFNAVVDIRSGACNGANIGCSDATTSGGTEVVALTSLTVGSTYLIRIYSFGNGVGNQGTFTICVTEPAPAPPPANDDCANAIALTPSAPGAACSPVSGTTINATESLPAISCGVFPGFADDDVWYKFVATSTAHDVNVTSVSQFDAVVDVRSGACNGANIGCADAQFLVGTETVQLSGLTVGSTYLVRVYSLGADTGDPGTFTICVTTPILTPSCAGAPAPANASSSCQPGPGSLSWASVAGATSYDVYFGTATTPPFVTNTTNTSFSTGSLSAGTYYWQVVPRNSAGAATGCAIWSFTIQANPVGNVFGNPIIIPSLPYSTTNNTFDFNCWTDDYTGPSNQASPDAFYRLTTEACQNKVSLSLCGSSFDTRLYLLNASGEEIFSNNDDGPLCAGLQASLEAVLPAGTYYIVVEGHTANFGTYSLNVSATDGTPPVVTTGAIAASYPTVAAAEAAALAATSATDNCPGMLMETASTTGTCSAVITVTTADAAGNSTSTTYNTRIDNTPPVVTTGTIAAAYTTVAAAEAAALAATSATDNCPGMLTETASTMGTCFAVITVTTTDAAGNSTPTTYNTRIDNTPPVVTTGTIAACYPTVAAAQSAALAATSATDNCPGMLGSSVATTGTCSAVITVTITDEAGNSAPAIYNTRIDNTPPTLVCRTGTVLVDGTGNYTLLPADVFDAAASSGNCPGTLTVTNISPATVNCSQLGQTIPVTVTAQDGCGNSATCTAQITVQESTALPAGWSSNDVGTANGSGLFKSCTSGGQFTVMATGFSTSSSDVLHLVSRQLCGNGEIIAHVAGVSGAGWAGITLRETLAPGSKKVALKTQFSNNIRREIRTATNAATNTLNLFRQDRWLRLVRNGSNFVGYSSTNGVTWDFAFSATVSMTGCIYVGLFAESINANVVTTATFDHVTITGSGALLAAQDVPVTAEERGFEVFPNPTKGEITVDLYATYANRQVSLELYDMQGKVLQMLEIGVAEPTTQRLDLSTFHNGVYLIRVRSAGLPDAVKRIVLIKE